jgi:hypothetical protein
MMPPAEPLYTSPGAAATMSSSTGMPMTRPTTNGTIPPGMVMPMNGEMPVAVGIPGMKDDGSPGFDWDQWDAVFGHYVPVDDFMELDSGGTWSLGAWDGTSLG